MPSSHAQSLSYLSVYAASGILLCAPQVGSVGLAHAAAAAVLLLGLFMVSVRLAYFRWTWS